MSAPDTATRSTRFKRIWIDELSYRVGQRYLTVVVDHDSGRLVWAGEGRDKKTVARFVAELGEERNRGWSSSRATWATGSPASSRRECPRATLCLDPYHVVALASAALTR